MTNQANMFELKATRAIVNDPDVLAEVNMSKLTPCSTTWYIHTYIHTNCCVTVCAVAGKDGTEPEQRCARG